MSLDNYFGQQISGENLPGLIISGFIVRLAEHKEHYDGLKHLNLCRKSEVLTMLQKGDEEISEFHMSE